ncbi:MAG: hypothetical protein N2109_02200 [Fimbriimonadales bacterium]|nr:hypothetical protein [Fimbriimonadales bacterium]
MAPVARCLVWLALLSAACSRAPDAPAADTGSYDRLRELTFGYGAVASLLADCVESADGALALARNKPATQGALREIRGLLDSAGSALAEHSDEPPPIARVASSPGGIQGALSAALEAGRDAAAELEEARNQLLDLLEVAPPSLQSALSELRDRVEGVLTELGDLLEASEPPGAGGEAVGGG